jgi:tetratricopeptide (TPR) repeat protein
MLCATEIRTGAYRGVALAVVLASIAAGPARAATADYAACLALVERQPEKAVAEAEAWLAKGGGINARRCQARAFTALGRYADAAQAFAEAAVSIAPGARLASGERAALLAQAGQAWLVAGRGDRAEALFSEAVALFPADPELRIDRAQALADQGRWLEAIDDLTRALAIDPQGIDARVLRGSALRQAGELVRALDDLNLALSRDSGHLEALLERGLVRAQQGDEVGARHDWTQVVGLAPNSRAAETALNLLRETEDLRPSP